jgi:uncharacterized protein (TIRG00374 family)
MTKETKALSGKLIFFVILIIFVWAIITHFAQTKQIVSVMAHGRWYWIGLALLCQIFFYPFYAYFLEAVFKVFKVNFVRKKVLPVYMATKFTDVTLPVATVGKVLIFVRYGKKHELSPLGTGIGISFVLLLEMISFLIISIISLGILAFFGQTRGYLIATLLFLFLFVLFVVLFIIKLSIYKQTPGRYFLWAIKYVARLSGQGSVEYHQIEKIFLEIGDDLRRSKDQILPTIGLSIGVHLINMLTFAFIYLAFVGHLNVSAVVAGYIAGLLFTIVSITPQGVGVAEAVMVETLHSFGLDVSSSAVVTLAFRGLLYWLPVFVGFYFFSRLELKSDTLKINESK